MTDTAPAAPAAKTYVAATIYSVTLSRVAEFPKGSGIILSPRHNPHEMTGAVCLEIADAIADAKPV